VSMTEDQESKARFVVCVEGTADPSSDVHALGKQCADTTGVDAAQLLSCLDGPAGAKAQLVMAQQTVMLGSKRPGTPYITVDGVPLSAPTLPNLLSAVCAKLTAPLPPGCPSSS